MVELFRYTDGQRSGLKVCHGAIGESMIYGNST